MNNDLLDIPAIADLIGLVPGSVEQMRTHGKLPVPDVTLGRTKRWKESTILGWDRERTKRYDNRKNANG